VTFEELKEQSNRTLLAFLETEADLGLTFLGLAQYERRVGNTEHYRKLIEAALTAVETIDRFKERLPADAKRKIETRVGELNGLLSSREKPNFTSTQI